MKALSHTAQLKGLWVALDHCRYDQATLQPVEGLLVDADEDLAELCARLREAGRSSCAITFCDDDDVVASIVLPEEDETPVAEGARG